MELIHEVFNKLDPAADLHVLYAGRYVCPPGHAWQGRREHALLHHVVSGKGKIRLGRKEWQLGAGCSFLFFPRESMYYEADIHDPWTYA